MDFEKRKKIWQEARTKSMQQHFFLPKVPPSVRLDFEPLSYENGMQLLKIFKKDKDLFVDERFKTKAKVEDYLAAMMEYLPFSSKNAAFDWLLRLNSTGEYVGVLHLHELSNQVFGSANRKATIGYAIGEKYRRKGYISEAITHFSTFLFDNSKIIRLLVYTDKANQASVGLMQSLNWVQQNDKYVYSDTHAFFELWKEGYESFK